MIGSGKAKTISNDLAREWCEIKVIGQILPLLDLLERVSSVSDRFPLLWKLVSIAGTLPTTASYEKGISVTNMVKAALGHHCSQAALIIQWRST
jgi:hypothetical protein